MRSQSQIRFGPRLTPVVKNLIIINTALYIGLLLLAAIAPNAVSWIRFQFALVPAATLQGFKFWQFITYAFLHGSLWHLLWNMVILWMFGAEVEAFWGRRPFIYFYLLCTLGGGVAVFFGELLGGFDALKITLGASGAILGVVVAYGMLFADRYLNLLFPPITIKAKWLALGWVILDFLFFLEGSRGISYYAHFGGALTAFIYLKSGFRFSPSARFRWGGLTFAEQFRRWRTRRHLRLIVDRDKEDEEDNEPRGPTMH